MDEIKQYLDTITNQINEIKWWLDRYFPSEVEGIFYHPGIEGFTLVEISVPRAHIEIELYVDHEYVEVRYEGADEPGISCKVQKIEMRTKEDWQALADLFISDLKKYNIPFKMKDVDNSPRPIRHSITAKILKETSNE